MLENLTLQSLGTSKLKPLFDQAMNEVTFSLTEDKDVQGERSITIKLSMKPKDGYVITKMSCKAKVPERTAATMTTVTSEGGIKIDTESGDARQLAVPIKFDDKVVNIGAKKEGIG